MTLRPLSVLLVSAWVVAAGIAEAKSYSAERFDARIRVLHGGALEVTETVAFRFESGTFSEVFRDIPERRTDGIEVLSASMDGRPFPFGTDRNQVSIRLRNSRVRVQWRFDPVSPSTHTFELVYRARGVVEQQHAGDHLAWRALPDEHGYPIDSARVDVILPEKVAAAPLTVDAHRVPGGASTASTEGGAVATASRIGRNGWIKVSMTLAPGTLIAAPPAWQQRDIRAKALIPSWLTAAGLAAAIGLVLIFAIGQHYDRPPRDVPPASPIPGVPEALQPAAAGALAANGRVGPEHSMAALVGLAGSGVLSVEELPKPRLGRRTFVVERTGGGVPLGRSDRAVLDAVFDGNDGAVSLSVARRRLVRANRRITDAVHQELRDAGLVDDDRTRVRRRTFVTALTLVVLAAVLLVVGGVLAATFGPYPLLVPAALAAAGGIGLAAAASMTPLTNEGLRRAARWQSFRMYLREVASDEHPVPDTGAPSMLPFVIALGLAGAWAKYLKRHPAMLPVWFKAAAAGDGGGLSAFVAYGGYAGGGGAAGAGGSAGGGASGAH